MSQTQLKTALMAMREFKTTKEQAVWLQRFQWANLRLSNGKDFLSRINLRVYLSILRINLSFQIILMNEYAGPGSAVGNMSGYRCVSDCRSRGLPVRSHTFLEIDHEIISTVILLPSAIYSRRVVVSYKQKYVHELLVNCLFKPAQEKVWFGELTIPP